jgi:hypothetical protein
MKEIKLSNDRGVTLVDDEDYEWLIQWKWHFDKEGYACRTSPRKDGPQRQIYMHREIMKTPKGMKTDHINGKGLDNRRENLRICTHAENMANQKIRRDNTSGYKGVTRDKNKWVAQIKKDKILLRIGLFSNPIEAARAYDKSALENFGEFAKLNFPL